MGGLTKVRETPVAFDPVGVEVGRVDGENRIEGFPSRPMDQCRNGKIHGSIFVARHQVPAIQDSQYCAGIGESITVHGVFSDVRGDRPFHRRPIGLPIIVSTMMATRPARTVKLDSLQPPARPASETLGASCVQLIT
jgi:hypothetical protein